MVHAKAMGIGAMFVLLIISVILLPIIVRYIDENEPYYAISGFRNQASTVMVPAAASSAELPSWVPDKNTNYLCRSPNESGTPCEEGWFCDGTTQRCVKQFPDSDNDVDGYYS